MTTTALSMESSPSTAILYERLTAHDIEEIEAMILADPELRAHFIAAASDEARQVLTLTYGIWLGHPAATAATGLSAAQPPEDVHVMARGPMAAAGGLYDADLLVTALASIDVDMEQIERALDFGCSSGRVVRVLAAAYPKIHWSGCDPNGPAIEWAREHLPGGEFFVSGNGPPLPLDSNSLDLVYAISIWSHFGPALGLRWFEEMHRVIRPGGYLMFTTHGVTAVGYYATLALRTATQSEEILDQLYRTGYWYSPEFGEEGDWGVIDPEWGTAFQSAEWLLSNLCPRWRVLEFAAGRNQDNQDVYVLQRV